MESGNQLDLPDAAAAVGKKAHPRQARFERSGSGGHRQRLARATCCGLESAVRLHIGELVRIRSPVPQLVIRNQGHVLGGRRSIAACVVESVRHRATGSQYGHRRQPRKCLMHQLQTHWCHRSCIRSVSGYALRVRNATSNPSCLHASAFHHIRSAATAAVAGGLAVRFRIRRRSAGSRGLRRRPPPSSVRVRFRMLPMRSGSRPGHPGIPPYDCPEVRAGRRRRRASAPA